jgi:SWI/SNF related-matrix-associated actin-dependent regulator of chromatin subfamily C
MENKRTKAYNSKMANTIWKKKDIGGPNHRFFESSETIQSFETVRQWLQKNCKKVSFHYM